MTSLSDLSVAELRDGLRAKTFSARELAQTSIDQLARTRDLNAFITETPERALADAARADTNLQRGAGRQTVGSGGTGPPPYSVFVRRVFGLGAPVLLAVAGVTLAAEAGGGLYWWPAAIVVAFACALTNAWVLLIEILR